MLPGPYPIEPLVGMTLRLYILICLEKENYEETAERRRTNPRFNGALHDRYVGLYCYHFAADAAREATRLAIVRGSTCNTIFGSGYCSPTSALGTGADGNDIAQYVRTLGYPYSASVTTATKWCTNGQAVPATWTTCSTVQSGNNLPGNQVQVTVSYSYPLVIPFVGKKNINLSSVSSMTIVQ